MWLLPSRGRPKSVERFFAKFAETEATTRGIVYVDDDDTTLAEYAQLELPVAWTLSVQRRIGLGPMQNRAFHQNPNEPWYGMMADDVVPTTLRWDVELIRTAGRDGVAYGDDGINAEKQATHMVIGGDLARFLGWLVLPGLTRIYGDNVMTEIARARGALRYVPHVKLDHWHFSNGKSPMDETYLKPEAAQDRMIYDRWRGEMRPDRYA